MHLGLLCGLLRAAISGNQPLKLKRSGGTMLEKTELRKLQAFLGESLGNDSIRVSHDPKNVDQAAVILGERQIGTIALDDEDGDRSFSFAMKIPVGREVLQEYLRRLFENESLKIVGRANKTDSVELNSGPDYLGVIPPKTRVVHLTCCRWLFWILIWTIIEA